MTLTASAGSTSWPIPVAYIVPMPWSDVLYADVSVNSFATILEPLAMNSGESLEWGARPQLQWPNNDGITTIESSKIEVQPKGRPTCFSIPRQIFWG
ncbi:MAG TPA: hypothetical protein DCE18_13340 [Syntrophobacteraceae bacterium]|nr:hypothetical protein [Syntrophobacteraceae bacterium]HBZ56850.1 hypothetical protein [Syntrophobacteraceae bacterium]